MVKLYRLEAYLPCESVKQAKEIAKKITELSEEMKLRGPVAFAIERTRYHYDDLESVSDNL